MINVINVYYDDHLPEWHNRLEHVKSHFIVLITEGRLLYRLNGELKQAARGDLVFIPSGTSREACNDGDVLHCKYAAAFTWEEPDITLPLLQRREPLIYHTRHFDFLKQRYIALHRQSLERRFYYTTIQAGILTEMLGFISRELDTPSLPKLQVRQIDLLEQYLLAHYRKSITLTELAGCISRSRNYTLVLFKEAVGLTPLEYQHRLRISAAKELLRNTRATVAFIAEHLGYYDSSAFNKMFRKHTGLSPSEYAAGNESP